MSDAGNFHVGGLFEVGEGKATQFGRPGIPNTSVRGSAYLEGPCIIGDPSQFAKPVFERGSLMAGQTANPDTADSPTFLGVPFYSFFASTFARIKGFLKVDTLLCVKVIKSKVIYAEVIMAKVKNFSIPHPTLPNTNLVYACLEGPENAVYVRGVLRNKDTIYLPEVWKDIVSPNSITVSLTSVGIDQGLMVKRVANNQVVVQAKPGLPIHCHYHIFAERNDVEKLQTEVAL
jgi:hypothetical protein|tara:strand:+ start:123 stop:818 length:696 start_codon:yes stop_codon:yes gene_type:complete